MRARMLTVAVIAVLAVAGLAGCKSSLGTAAVVDGVTISDSQVSQAITPDAKPVEISQTASLSPRAFAVSVLVGNKLLPKVVAKGPNGGPSKADLASIRSRALSSKSAQTFVTAQGVKGYTSAFAGEVVTYIVYLQVLRTYATNGVNVSQLISSAKTPVHVSPRYGSWDKSTLLVSTAADAGLPGFISLQPSSAAGAGTQSIQVPNN